MSHSSVTTAPNSRAPLSRQNPPSSECMALPLLLLLHYSHPGRLFSVTDDKLTESPTRLYRLPFSPLSEAKIGCNLFELFFQKLILSVCFVTCCLLGLLPQIGPKYIYRASLKEIGPQYLN